MIKEFKLNADNMAIVMNLFKIYSAIADHEQLVQTSKKSISKLKLQAVQLEQELKKVEEKHDR